MKYGIYSYSSTVLVRRSNAAMAIVLYEYVLYGYCTSTVLIVYSIYRYSVRQYGRTGTSTVRYCMYKYVQYSYNVLYNMQTDLYDCGCTALTSRTSTWPCIYLYCTQYGTSTCTALPVLVLYSTSTVPVRVLRTSKIIQVQVLIVQYLYCRYKLPVVRYRYLYCR